MNEDKLRIRLKNILDNKGMLLQNATFDLIVELVLTFTKRMSKKNNKQGQKISALEAELQHQLQINTGSSSKDERIAELEGKIKKMEYKVRSGYYEIKNILIENERLRKVLAHSADRIVELEMQLKSKELVIVELQKNKRGFDLNDVVIRDQKINELNLEISIFEQFKSQNEHSIKVLKTALASKMKEVTSLNEKLNQIRGII